MREYSVTELEHAEQAHAKRRAYLDGKEWRPMIDGKPVIITHVSPPIALRHYDYSATLEGYEPGDPKGWGRTELMAYDDLAEQVAFLLQEQSNG